ncbi:MAG: B12-binding domain-containing radical SAM protein [Armatimonadota bacterium]
MRALLIDPTIPGEFTRRSIRWAPLGPAYLAASLREAGHEVHLHNRLNLKVWQGLSLPELDRATTQLMERIAPDLIGISGVTAAFGDMVAVAEIARRTRPEATIVLGGPHATTLPTETLERMPSADCLVMGEGEKRIVQLAAGMSARDLPGVAWRGSGGEVQMNPWEAPQWPLDSLPHPARDLLEMRRYIKYSRAAIRGSHIRSTGILSSRGCHHRCAFCSEPAYSVRGYRTHSAEHTVNEAKAILAQYGVPALMFLDENFTADRERVMRLMRLWRQEGLADRAKFAIQARADALDTELLAALKDAGCIHIELGVESGSDRVLRRMNKGCTVAQNRAAAEMVKATGIRLQVNIICGSPGETERELLSSFELVEAVNPETASIVPFMLLPGTAYARELIAEGRIEPDFWDVRERQARQPVQNFSAMSDETFRELWQRGAQLADRLYVASGCEPWWYRLARTVKRRLTRLRRRRRG